MVYNRGREERFIRATGRMGSRASGSSADRLRASYPERFPYLCRKEDPWRPGVPDRGVRPRRLRRQPLHPSRDPGNNDNFVMWANLPNCGIVRGVPVVSAAALKGDHLDARSTDGERELGGTARGDTTLYTPERREGERRLPEIDRQTQQGPVYST